MIHPTNNLNVSQKIIWHLKVVVAAAVITMLFSLAIRGQIFHDGLMIMLILTLVQLEAFICLGTWFFQSVKTNSPNFLKRLLLRLVSFYLSVLVISFIMFLCIFAFHFFRGGGHISHFISEIPIFELKSFFIAAGVGFAFGAFFFFYSQLAEALKREQKLKEEKLIFQYETLKSQVNPHFLFNSLNTLSSLIRKDVNLSEEFIQKLSAVYRYVLEHMENELVPVSNELQFVKDFFYLQKIRDQEKIKLTIELDENVSAEILPVSLQMLVENALKHNSATRNEPLEITIHFEGLDKLVVRNRLQRKMQIKDSSKIGLKNLNERCKLILKKEIEVQETAEEFVVKVPVKLV